KRQHVDYKYVFRLLIKSADLRIRKSRESVQRIFDQAIRKLIAASYGQNAPQLALPRYSWRRSLDRQILIVRQASAALAHPRTSHALPLAGLLPYLRDVRLSRHDGPCGGQGDKHGGAQADGCAGRTRRPTPTGAETQT
ncbi:hypothetical protein, partial [Ensifer sp. MJa1]|uniref:hypothetical protein n=1 Tax=Ensifer sp. MJa1 TaxID=2919888 RepID=UPI003009EF00